MNKREAKKIAIVITNEQIEELLHVAKTKIEDWSVASSINATISKGASWNILTATNENGQLLIYGMNDLVVKIVKTNIIWEFGDYLDPSLRQPNKPKTKKQIDIYHEDPLFMNDKNSI